ncbi:uncharacterized protein J4E88_010939 [Alternaria novae-zelandiae]|uniref:uncharacterized protein n=1 Tax=Alternaria novae-zelandiae TaxID=430562 RepID=UPI0020C3539B|nr:uncharacterized protein J4E88_010939 [Alternaria novae-zelandiae]KAI4662149.1 hypothetical protein J4E88_010939 [Alternaria novae-zelandiae]
MASGTKKRRKSQSPARGTTSKRARVASSGTSNRTQHHEHDSHSSRAGSVKDTYLAQKQGRPVSLPTGDDWVFRVKVISSATDLGNDLFKNAVQGLVRICFPEGILDQLGPQVLEQHMREEKAPERNIERMSEIFQSEMEQRMASMLAEHLDTAAKIDSVMRTVLSASARAHGDKLGEDILGYVTDSLLKLKAKASEHSTEWLASGDAAATEEEEEGSSDGGSSTSDISDKEPTPPPKVKKLKKRDRKSRRARSKTPDDILEDVEVDNNVPATLPKQHTSNNKDRKISSTWQWHVDTAELADEGVAEAFPRTSDLFAYHALPISQRKLGSSASKKEIRCEMQSLLDGMPKEEFEKWVESLQKLLDGDRDMLKRQESQSSGHKQQLSRVTPAPIDTRRQARKITKTLLDVPGPSKPRTDKVQKSHERTVVKDETTDSSDEISDEPNDENIAEATAALRHPLTKGRDIPPPAHTPQTALVQSSRGLTSRGDVDGSFGMPVLALLWGSDNLTVEECVKDGAKITSTIMNQLERRVSVKRIAVSSFGGIGQFRTQDELREHIMRAFPAPGEPVRFLRIKKGIEGNLVPWVIAEPSAFPELKGMPFVFAHVLPSLPITVNLLFGTFDALSRLKASELWEAVLQALQRRGISEASIGAVDVDFLQLESLTDTSRYPFAKRRSLLERILRRVIFPHKEKFPELKSSSVVKTWEQMTNLSW